MKTFKEYRMETEASNTTYKLVDKKQVKLFLQASIIKLLKRTKKQVINIK